MEMLIIELCGLRFKYTNMFSAFSSIANIW